MKFVSLALALLLAVGSQAAAMPPAPGDVPGQVAHTIAAMQMAMDRFKQEFDQALVGVQDEEVRTRLSNTASEMHLRMSERLTNSANVATSVTVTIYEAYSTVIQSIMADIESLKSGLATERMHLRTVVLQHIEQYKAFWGKLQAYVQELATRETEPARAVFEPVVEELSVLVPQNLEETKTALMPIVDTVIAKIRERVQELKTMAGPHIEESRDQIAAYYRQLAAIDRSQVREDVAEPAQVIRDKFQQILAILMSHMQPTSS